MHKAWKSAAVAISTAMIIAVALAGCGSSGSSSHAASAATGKSSGGAPQTGIKIGYAVPVVANPYFQENIGFAKQMAGQLGASLIVENSNGEDDTQLQDVEDLVSKGVKGVLFAPDDPAVVPSILKLCQKSHIMCAADERSPGVAPTAANQSYFAGYVVPNNTGLAAQAAQALDHAGARRCVAMSGQVGNPVADQRLSGFVSYAKGHSMQVLSTFRPAELASDGQQATENFLSKLPGPQFNCVFGFDGDVAVGSISALSHAGALSKVKVAAIGTEPENVSEIKSGQMAASAGGGAFLDGGFALIMIYDALNHHYATRGAVELNGVTVTRANVAHYAQQFALPVKGYNAKQLSNAYNPHATKAEFTVGLK